MQYQTIITSEFWDEIEEKIVKKMIFFFSEGPKDAMEKACNWFGEDNIDNISIRFFEDIPLEVDDFFIQRYLDEKK